MKGLEGRIECTFLRNNFCEESLISSIDTCMEKEQAGIHDALRKYVQSVGYKLCTF